MTTYQSGDIVRYARPEPGEETLTFTLLEDNGDRVLIASRDFPSARLTPQECIAKDEIAPLDRRDLMTLRDAALTAGDIATFQTITTQVARLPMKGVQPLTQKDKQRYAAHRAS